MGASRGPYMSVREVANEIGVPVKSVYRWVREGNLPGIQLVTEWGNRTTVVKRGDVVVFLRDMSRRY